MEQELVPCVVVLGTVCCLACCGRGAGRSGGNAELIGSIASSRPRASHVLQLFVATRRHARDRDLCDPRRGRSEGLLFLTRRSANKAAIRPEIEGGGASATIRSGGSGGHIQTIRNPRRTSCSPSQEAIAIRQCYAADMLRTYSTVQVQAEQVYVQARKMSSNTRRPANPQQRLGTALACSLGRETWVLGSVSARGLDGINPNLVLTMGPSNPPHGEE
ncbi:hypothetical protein THAOC_28796 [Thalassiosira oceanica]|uniref:Uncharacterized protein n=1 Tax=Thalassiosira oceanica TaxID=159749 RepID=K0RFE3_THAOC|nr:hypothetical protein THAOC_28796 [Thalassiosira oceanica]|eukprot:EJK51980.1 hypothetical protein THAOC_28796 [Thalassiosira oceanica]